MAPEIRLWNPDELQKEIEQNKQKKLATPYNPFKADIFSFGILLTAIISNSSNFYNTNSLNKLNDHKFEKVILDCLKDPNERPNVLQLLEYQF